MNGEEEYSTSAKKKFEDQLNKLEEYGEAFKPDRPDLLEISSEKIKLLDDEEKNEYAIDLASYALYIQKELSKQKAMLKWLESTLSIFSANHLSDFEGYYTAEQRKHLVIANDNYAKQLEMLRVNTEMKVTLLENIPFQINHISRLINGAGYGKTNNSRTNTESGRSW